MRTTLLQSTRAAWWMLGAVLVFGCAKGSMLETGAGGAGSGGGSVTTTSSSGFTTTTSSSSGTTTTSSSSSSGTTTSSSSSSTTSSSSTSSSSTSGMVCTSPQHLCNGSCVANTPDTGCYLSSACTPCPAPTANGTATCSASGICDLKCDTGYQANAAKTDCVAIPPPMTCCDDSECPLFTICLDGTCQSPLGGTCDPTRCNDFCKCTAGGSATSTGMCNLDVFVWECLCTP